LQNLLKNEGGRKKEQRKNERQKEIRNKYGRKEGRMKKEKIGKCRDAIFIMRKEKNLGA
jgi:hypothetical protein